MNDFDFSPSFFFSRAVDYDEEEDEATKDFDCSSASQSVPPIPSISYSEQSISCSLLLLAIGPASSGFVKTHVLDEHASEVVGEITCGTSESDDKSSSDRTCKLCQLTDVPEVVVLTCEIDVKPEETFVWTQQLFARVAVKSSSQGGQVVVLTSTDTGNYISDLPPGDMPECFLHSLATRSFSGIPVAPMLAQPNLVTGLPAQVLTYCEVNCVPAVLYICYARSLSASTAAVTAFRQLCKSSSLADIIVASEKSKQRAIELSSKFSSATYNSLYL